jgi:hypothetical protein
VHHGLHLQSQGIPIHNDHLLPLFFPTMASQPRNHKIMKYRTVDYWTMLLSHILRTTKGKCNTSGSSRFWSRFNGAQAQTVIEPLSKKSKTLSPKNWSTLTISHHRKFFVDKLRLKQLPMFKICTRNQLNSILFLTLTKSTTSNMPEHCLLVWGGGYKVENVYRNVMVCAHTPH